MIASTLHVVFVRTALRLDQLNLLSCACHRRQVELLLTSSISQKLHLPTQTPTMSGDESSDLSSVPSEDELDLQLSKKDGILKFFSKAPKPAPATKIESPPRPKREASPPHEYVLADNPDIAVCICVLCRIFRSFTRIKRVSITLNDS